jgi:hypothetical protein
MQWFQADKSNTVCTNSSERYYDVTQSRSGPFRRQPLTESSVQKAHTSLWLPATGTVICCELVFSPAMESLSEEEIWIITNQSNQDFISVIKPGDIPTRLHNDLKVSSLDCILSRWMNCSCIPALQPQLEIYFNSRNKYRTYPIIS